MTSVQSLPGQVPDTRVARRRAALPALPALEDMAMGFCAAGVAMAVTDAVMRIVTVNAAYAAMTGCTPGALQGRHLFSGARGSGLRPVVGLRDAHPWRGEVVLHHRDGQARPLWMSVDPVLAANGSVQRYVVSCTDISALKRQQDELRHQAQHDPLTGLPHRALFEAELQLAIAAAHRHERPFALLFIDLDHFKQVNDTLGHEVGDRLLREISLRLRQCVRAEDVVARLGGDEFTVLLQGVAHNRQASRLAKVILAAIERSFVAGEHCLHVSASIGIALFPRDADNAGALLRAADVAMYRAKQHGRGRIAMAGVERVAPAPPHAATGR